MASPEEQEPTSAALSRFVVGQRHRDVLLAVGLSVLATMTANRTAGQWSSLHLLWGFTLTGVCLSLTVTGIRGRRRDEHTPAAGSRLARSVCAVSATGLVLPLVLLCGYLVGDRQRWWRITQVDNTARSAVLEVPPDAVLAVVSACAALLVAVWLLRPWSWRGSAVAAAGALALASWFAQLRDVVPPSLPGNAYGFAPYGELQGSHPVDPQGLPGVLLLASLAIAAVAAVGADQPD